MNAITSVWSSMIITTYICIYTYKHRGLYKFAHFVCTIIIVMQEVTIVHIVSDCYELSKDAVALCLSISLHMVKYFVTRYMYIYIYMRICVYIYTYICARSCILYCKKLDILWSLLVTNSDDSLIYTSQKNRNKLYFHV